MYKKFKRKLKILLIYIFNFKLSDHGMATIKNQSDLIQLDDYVDINLIDKNKTMFGEVSHIFPLSKDDVKIK